MLMLLLQLLKVWLKPLLVHQQASQQSKVLLLLVLLEGMRTLIALPMISSFA